MLKNIFKNNFFRVFSGFKWSLFLIWPSAIVFTYICYFTDCFIIYKGPNESLAIIITVATVLVFLWRVCVNRNPLEIILLALSIALLCRELHFEGTTKGIYISLIVIVIWCVLWRKKISEVFFNSPTKSYMIFTLLTYLLSQMIARRAFKGILPMEAESDVLRTGLEEIMENVGHIMLFITAIKGFNVKKNIKY